MAHKDYVARGRKTKAAPLPPKRSLPWLRIIITLGLLGGFVFLLWSIKDKGADPVTGPQPAVSDAVDALPDMPEEEWDFIKSLPEYTVEVDVQDRPLSDQQYLMQCGSFRVKAQAEKMKAQIAFQGLEAQVRPSENGSGRWHRVILGPYTSKRRAETHRHTLQKAKITTCKIWNWNL
ncbi:MAG: cell division protein FtsN [Paraglaciecola sp.]|jgi:cell division protein FtsN